MGRQYPVQHQAGNVDDDGRGGIIRCVMTLPSLNASADTERRVSLGIFLCLIIMSTYILVYVPNPITDPYLNPLSEHLSDPEVYEALMLE